MRSVAVACRSDAGLQPRQLPASVGVAETGPALVTHDAPREADQDRAQGDATLEVRDVSTGGVGLGAELVRGNARPDRAVGDPAAGSRVWNAGLGTRR